MNGTNIQLEPNSKPYLLKRIISDGFDTVLIFVLFMVISVLIFSSPLANVYNEHYANYKRVQDEAAAEFGDDAEAIANKLNADRYYLDEKFAANLHAYLLKLTAGFIAEAAVLAAVPLISKQRGTPGKLMTGIIPFKEKKQTKADAKTILLRFVYVFIIDSAVFYLFTGILTFLLIPVIRLVEILINKKNKTLCDALTGVMMIEKLSYDGIDK
ncbi:MAG: RDD family protein [Clostridia bacterium]|nr:RDD family protein [Clostridia bacterium]